MMIRMHKRTMTDRTGHPVPARLRPALIAAWLCLLVGLPLSLPAAENTRDSQDAPAGKGYGDGVRLIDGADPNAEAHMSNGGPFTTWSQDESQFKKDEGPKFETRQVLEKKATTKKLTGLVPPIRFASGKADIPEEFVEKLRAILISMSDKVNVRLHFIGHTDNIKLQGEAKRKYGDNMELSKERAGTTAEFFQRALSLPPEAISYEGMGETQPVASNKTSAGRAKNRRVEVQIWYDEITEQMVDKQVEVDQKIKRIKVCRVETVCMLRYKEGHSRRTKLKNLVPPMHYNEAISDIPPLFLQQLRQALYNLRGKENVHLKFIAYSDNAPLFGRDARIYGDHLGLSKARARRVAQAIQDVLGLPASAVSSDGKGSVSPIASNNSEKGRALNRRIEVEFWHDDPLEDLPDTPQICPEASAAETVERVYNPPDGEIQVLFFENGQPVIPAGYTQRLKRIMEEVKDKGNVRLKFIGYTSNERLDRRTAMVYGDDVGLSTARARRARNVIAEQMGLNEKQTVFEGRGYVQSHDVANTGFLEGDQSKVEVQVVYDDLADIDDAEGIEIKRIVRDVETRNPFGLNLMRISVDGQPLNDPNKAIPDVQRCTDVAFDAANIRFHFDPTNHKPRLNVMAWPNVLGTEDSAGSDVEEHTALFRMYSNYPAFIDKAEVRLFRGDQSTRDKPVEVIPVNPDGRASWRYNPSKVEFVAPRTRLKYVLRVYDKAGRFDETEEQTLWIVDSLEKNYADANPERELLAVYGGNRLGVNNIVLRGGTVTAYGSQVPSSMNVWLAGRAVPVSDGREFTAELILPVGLQKVQLSVTDQDGNGNVYLRELDLPQSDWFYVAIADLTASYDSTNGPARLVTGDEAHYDNDLAIDGRLAYYTKGRFGDGWKLSSSADTREGPVQELFSNFLNKSPDAVFRRMDPDHHYPTYGDDGTVENDAPTSGKFYLKLEKDRSYGLWGDFRINYTDTDLAHVDRSLYGANINIESNSANSTGDKRYRANLFGAQPGTVAARDEFRGTSGSLYYLRHQDIRPGTERLRAEVRDAVSGKVLSVRNLTPGIDYDVDYIQGRLMLTEPLSSSADNGMLVNSGDAGGNQVYLVARYEYTPGFDDINDINTGGRVHYWFADRARFGLTAEQQQIGGEDASISAADLMVKLSEGSWIKYERSRTVGPGLSTLSSVDGGFSFGESAPISDTSSAAGQRFDTAVRFGDLVPGLGGKMSLYYQSLEAGYAAPGLIANTDTTHSGANIELPISPMFSTRLKTDSKEQENGLTTKAHELDLSYHLSNMLKLSTGVRVDERTDNSPAVPLTQQQGKRTDMVLRLDYNSLARWSGFGYLQGTTSVDDGRQENNRAGIGGAYRVGDRLNLTGELSEGDTGTAVSLGTDYKMSDNTKLYNAYTLSNDRGEDGVLARRGKLAAGFRTRYSDTASVYMEERYSHGDTPTGLTHSMGFDLVPTEGLNFGANLDLGSLRHNVTGALTNRTAAGVRIGAKVSSFTYAGALEFREDESEQPDTTMAVRTTWLTRNSFKYQASPAWRLLAKLNHSESTSSLGEFYDGQFSEVVIGAGIRADSLNALFKATHFYNVPAAEQVTVENTASEYIQRSNILAVDFTWDMTRRWSLGGKYAYRAGELAQDRVDPQFFRSDAALVIARVDWHLLHHWDLMSEWRRLQLPQAGDTRMGFLFAIYQHWGEHMKAGIGYNFTEFSDDLTDLDYDSHGVFINVIGKF